MSFASMIGSAGESHDFFIYVTAAADRFGKIFFQTNEPIIAVLAASATLAVGFMMRPLGGYLAGHFGVRSSGISLGYNGASVVAEWLPFLATGLYAVVGWTGPAIMFSLRGVISSLCALSMRESAPAGVERHSVMPMSQQKVGTQ
ncbi:hypothetical protein [Paraburkholderia panacisoli]|uniref:hypothetical protein n=1 Tax=Paraburkholderia panacisoli TaxID=2603818 RepID=UPI001CB74FA8|nr:hypothetical protein [Paraburkholderia panacisoli]